MILFIQPKYFVERDGACICVLVDTCVNANSKLFRSTEKNFKVYNTSRVMAENSLCQHTDSKCFISNYLEYWCHVSKCMRNYIRQCIILKIIYG